MTSTIRAGAAALIGAALGLGIDGKPIDKAVDPAK